MVRIELSRNEQARVKAIQADVLRLKQIIDAYNAGFEAMLASVAERAGWDGACQLAPDGTALLYEKPPEPGEANGVAK